VSRRRRKRRRTKPDLAASELPDSLMGDSALLERVGPASGAWLRDRWLATMKAVALLPKETEDPKTESVLGLHIEPGIIMAKVASERGNPLIVRSDFVCVDAKIWGQVVSGLAEKAVFAAKLLAGEIPEEIEGAVLEAGGSLFPRKAEDILSKCGCGGEMPCTHLVAAHYRLAELFGRDPFLVFKLRGCPKEELLVALRRHRSGTEREDAEGSEVLDVVSPRAFWRAGEGVDRFEITIAPPMERASLLRRLGLPDLDNGEQIMEMMEKIYGSVLESVLADAMKGQLQTEDVAEGRGETPSKKE